MADPVTLGLDLGTSGVRVLAVSATGEVVAESHHGYPLLTPHPGWTEQRPADWTAASLAALRDMAVQLESREVVALGLSGQMHGLVSLDARGEPVRPAILWNDQRTGAAVTEIEAAVPRQEMIGRTGNPAITGFQLAKLVWLRREEPENFKLTKHVLLPKDYLGYGLTGKMAAEPSDASGTNCFNLTAKAWDQEILEALSLNASLFPSIIASHEQTGTLKVEWARATGLPEDIAIIAGAGDNAAAATGLGLGAHQTEKGSVSLGTSGVIFAPLTDPTPDPEGRVHLFCHADGGYHLLGVTLSAAGSLQWYRKTFAPDREVSELVALATQSSPGAGGVSFKPYLAGERTPHLNPHLRGSWRGLSLATTQADMVRSILEGVAFSLRDALAVIEPLAPLSEALATGGGAVSDLWLQMVSDVLGLPLTKPRHNQGAAYGAALLALQGVDLIQHPGDIVRTAGEVTFTPQQSDLYRKAYQRYRAV